MESRRCNAALAWMGILGVSSVGIFAIALANPTERIEIDAPPAKVEVRAGLPRVRAKLAAGEPISIAYLGGSLTELPGWSYHLTRTLQDRNPGTEIHHINAGLSATGSRIGVWRVERDVMAYDPDLVVIDFAVNDARASGQVILGALEEIVRRIRSSNPQTEILFVYLFEPKFISAFARGEVPNAIGIHEAVAAHYGIPSIEVASGLDRLRREGSIVLRGPENTKPETVPVFGHDGLHPYEFGNRLYARMLTAGLAKIFDSPPPPPPPARLPERLDDKNWDRARRLPLSSVKPGPGWRRKTSPRKSPPHAKAGELWESDEPDAAIEFGFRGRLLHVFEVRGPDAGDLAITIDGEELPPDSFRRTGPGTPIRVLPIRHEFKPYKTHRVSIRVAPLADDSDEAGTVRLGDLLVLGEVVP